MISRKIGAVLVGLVPALVACRRAEPPTRPDTPASTASAPDAAHARHEPSKAHEPPRDAAGPEDSGGAGAGTVDAATLPDASSIGKLAPPNLVGDDGKLLPQTQDEPSTSSAWFVAGSEALFHAIRDDDPVSAEPFFFPLAAYEKVKDVADPEGDYEHRLLAHFRRDVHAYHQKLGPRASDARLVGIELAEKNKRWMKPRSEGNRLGYFRVTHSRMRYDLGGREHTLEVTSFISWRGEWYLVHLSGFE